MVVNSIRILAILTFCLQAFAAKTFTIQPLIDPNQPSSQFILPNSGFGLMPVNNTPYLAGIVAGNAAVGSLNGSSFAFQALPPLPGGDFSAPNATLKDGSLVGYTFYAPTPNGNFAPPTITRWTNGVPVAIPIADPSQPTAVFPPGPFGVNSEGDIVGQYNLNGVVSAYRYNVFNQSFAVIPLPTNDVFQLLVNSINEQGKILALASGPTSQLLLFDPATGAWKNIPFPPSTGFAGQGILNSQGQFALTLVDLNSLSSSPFGYNGTDLFSLYAPALPPLQSPGGPIVRQAYGFNSAGTVIGNFNERIGLFEGGEFTELYPLIQNPAGWTPFQTGQTLLAGINDNGQIFGIAQLDGQRTSFILNPSVQSEIPEPSTTFLTLSSICTLLCMFRRHRHIQTKKWVQASTNSVGQNLNP